MDAKVLEQRKVYDPALRLMHAWNGIAVLGLIATAMLAEAYERGGTEDRIWHIHVLFGYGLSLGLAARLVWGLLGPRSARFSDMWHPGVWKRALLSLRIPVSRRYGHNALASAAYLLVYLALGFMAATGLALAAIEQGSGPLTLWLFDAVNLKEVFKEPHEAIAWLVGGFVCLHFAGLYYHERIERIPTARSMLTGWQYRHPKEESRHA